MKLGFVGIIRLSVFLLTSCLQKDEWKLGQVGFTCCVVRRTVECLEAHPSFVDVFLSARG